MKKTLVFTLSILALASSAQAASLRHDICSRGKLVAGVKYDSPPFGYLDDAGNPVGFDVDIVKEVQKDLSAFCKKTVTLELKQVVSKNRQEFIQNGSIDMAAATTTATFARMDSVDFSNIYFVDGQRLLVKSDSSIRSVKDLAGKKVGTAQGSTSETNIKAASPKALVQSFAQYTDAFVALQQGRVDAVTTDSTILLGLRASAEKPTDYKIVGAFFSSEPYGIIVKQDDSKWRNFINETLSRVGSDGTYKKIFSKWFGKGTKYVLTDPKSQITVPAQYPVRR
ncbi:MAG: transporter substrate-binding domain-containing protein [Pseudopedobacter sp.]|nr:transporter substrate-binding domain-containing protein [Deinococcales bacterium]